MATKEVAAVPRKKRTRLAHMVYSVRSIVNYYIFYTPGSHRHIVVDTLITHELGGNHLEEVSRNGQLLHSDANRLLENTASTKEVRYRDGYSTLKPTDRALWYLCFPAVCPLCLGHDSRGVLASPIHPCPPTHSLSLCQLGGR